MLPDLLVVNTRRWILDELATTSRQGRIYKSYGLDFPKILENSRTALWAPMQWVARASRTHPGLISRLTAPGPGWVCGVPEAWTLRKIYGGKLANLDEFLEREDAEVFVKLSEFKSERFQAGFKILSEAKKELNHFHPDAINWQFGS